MSRSRKFAWGLLAIAVIGWPASALTIASQEPQVVLGLSWLAIIYTSINILVTDQVDNS
jgi:hypothetical protein